MYPSTRRSFAYLMGPFGIVRSMDGTSGNAHQIDTISITLLIWQIMALVEREEE